MSSGFETRIVDLLNHHRILTLATLRPDGWPQATIIGYANDGLAIYFMIGRDSQKFANIARDPRVSIAIGDDTQEPAAITGLSMSARVAEVADEAERTHALARFAGRYREYAAFLQIDRTVTALMRARPEYVSILDYSKGFGHADLVQIDASAI